MIGSLIPHLSTLIVTVRRNMLSSVMTTLMILSIIIAWSARGNIATWLEQNPSAEQQKERIERGRESNAKIEAALKNDMANIKADRMLIRQFHDQLDPASGTIVPHITTTHIVMAPGVASPSQGIINLPRTYLADVTQRVYANPAKPVCVRIKTAEISNPIYQRFLIESGVAEQYICPITDIDGAPVGLIIAGFLTETKARPTDEQVFAEMTDTATRVSGYLAEVTAPERQSWYRKLLDS